MRFSFGWFVLYLLITMAIQGCEQQSHLPTLIDVLSQQGSSVSLRKIEILDINANNGLPTKSQMNEARVLSTIFSDAKMPELANLLRAAADSKRSYKNHPGTGERMTCRIDTSVGTYYARLEALRASSGEGVWVDIVCGSAGQTNLNRMKEYELSGNDALKMITLLDIDDPKG